MTLDPYLPVILFILIGVAVGVAPQVLGFLLGPRRPDQAKDSPYECGFEAFEDARMKFDVRYYLVAGIRDPRMKYTVPYCQVATLFRRLGREIAFLFTWAVAVREIGPTGFWA